MDDCYQTSEEKNNVIYTKMCVIKLSIDLSWYIYVYLYFIRCKHEEYSNFRLKNRYIDDCYQVSDDENNFLYAKMCAI